MSTATETIETAANLVEGVGDSLRFSATVKPQKYGDGKTFYVYRILMRKDGRVTGVEDGPDRTHKTPRLSRIAATRRIEELKRHRLYAIDITEKDIQHGEARSCESCAIAQALWRNQKRMGLSEFKYDFRVEPYGAFVACDGVVLTAPGYARFSTGEREMPDLVGEGRHGLFVESMYEWALHWDEWADSRNMTLKEWREENGYEDGETPYKPSPCSFVLNLTEMKQSAS